MYPFYEWGQLSQGCRAITRRQFVTTKTIKLGKVVSYYNRPPPIKSDEPLNMWSFEITCQIENVLSPLPQCLNQPKLAMW